MSMNFRMSAAAGGVIAGVLCTWAGAAPSYIYAVDEDHIALIDVNAKTFVVKNAAVQAWNIAPGTNLNNPLVESMTSLYRYNFNANTAALIAANVVPIENQIPANSFGEGSDGRLYVGNEKSLYRVNPITGAHNFVANTPMAFDGDIATVFTAGGARTFATAGNNLVELNVATGGMNILKALNNVGFGLAATADGRLFTHTFNEVYEINLTTYETTLIVKVDGMNSFTDMGSEIVPAPGAAALLLGGWCVAGVRRKR